MSPMRAARGTSTSITCECKKKKKELVQAFLERAAELGSDNALFQLGLFFDVELDNEVRAAECYRAVNPNAVALVNWSLGMLCQVRAGACLCACLCLFQPLRFPQQFLPSFIRGIAT